MNYNIPVLVREPLYLTPSPPSDFVSAYNRVHNLTAGDIYGNKGLKGYHPLCTVFLRHQLGQSPEWTLICTDESMAKNLR